MNRFTSSAIALLTAATSVLAQNLVDRDATAETVNVWNYLKSVYGKKHISGIWEQRQADDVKTCSEKTPAILGHDMNGWNLPRGSQNYMTALNQQSAALINFYNTTGGIVQVNWHWSNPFDRAKDSWSELTASQWNNLVTPGTADYNTIIEDIDWHVENYLKRFIDKNGKPIPMLFRPLHEIDGGWFWWTCKNDGTKTAQLYRILQDRIMNHHKMHNMIWIFNPGGDNSQMTVAQRQAYYPGADRIDIAGIDLYNMYFRTGLRNDPWSLCKSYKEFYDHMALVCPGKMLALCEGEAMPNPALMESNDANNARWLYSIAWWAKDEGSFNCTENPCNPCDWVNTCYNHSFVVTLSDLPDFSSNVPAPVIARASANITTGNAPLAVTFDGSSSNGLSLAYSWNFGDGATSTLEKPQHTFAAVGSFKVKLTVTSGTTASSDSITITTTAPGVEPSLRTINDATTGTGVNQFNFSGTWGSATNTAYLNDEHWSATTGSSYTVRFYGAQVILYGTKDVHHGIATVSIDGGAAVDVDFYSSTRSISALLWTSPALTKGDHSIVVTLSGRKNAASTGTVIVADRVDILQSAGTTSIASYQDDAIAGSGMQWRNLRIPSYGPLKLTITNAAGSTVGTYTRASLSAGLSRVENLPKGVYFVTITSMSTKSSTTQRVAKACSVR